VVIIGLSLVGAILYEVMKRREEAAAERMKELSRLAERSEIPAAQDVVAVAGATARYA
jgi:spermidine/putrescine transport system permease protein